MSQNSKQNSVWQLFKSVAASAFGVQTDANYQRDFQQTSFWPFLVVGVVFVIGFVLTLVLIVNLLVTS